MTLRDALDKTGMTQAELARRLKLTRQAVSVWGVHGVPDYRESQIREIAREKQPEQ